MENITTPSSYEEDFDLDLDEIIQDMDKHPIRISNAVAVAVRHSTPSLVQLCDERHRYVSAEESCLIKTIDIMKRDIILIDEFHRINNHDEIIMLFHRRFCEDNMNGVEMKSIFKADVEYILNSGYFAMNDHVSTDDDVCTWYSKVSMVDIGIFKWWLDKTRIMYDKNLNIYENQLEDIQRNPRYVLEEKRVESIEEKKCFIIS